MLTRYDGGAACLDLDDPVNHPDQETGLPYPNTPEGPAGWQPTDCPAAKVALIAILDEESDRFQRVFGWLQALRERVCADAAAVATWLQQQHTIPIDPVCGSALALLCERLKLYETLYGQLFYDAVCGITQDLENLDCNASDWRARLQAILGRIDALVQMRNDLQRRIDEAKREWARMKRGACAYYYQPLSVIEPPGGHPVYTPWYDGADGLWIQGPPGSSPPPPGPSHAVKPCGCGA